MGALTLNRKRVDECFASYNSPSPQSSGRHTSINLEIHNSGYRSSNRFDTHSSKKPRLCYNSSDQVSEEGGNKVLQTQQSAVSRLKKYPEPGKLPREVHAPCSRPRRFDFPSRLSFGIGRGVSEKETAREAEEMGNGTSSVLWQQYKKAKDNAFDSLRFLKVRKEERFADLEAERKKDVVVLEDSSDVEILDEGNVVSSEEGRGVGSKGLGSVLESQRLDGRPMENSVVHSGSMMGRDAYQKLLSIVDRDYTQKLSYLGSDIQYYEAKRSSFSPLKSFSKRKEEERQLQELKKAQEDLRGEPFVPLTEEEKNEVKQALSNANRRRVLVTHENSNIQITGEMLQCLRPGAWLNDEVINVYLELLKERERREPKKFLNCHFFNTFFYKKLIGRNGYDYKSVRRWTSQRKLGYKLMDCDKIFVPIHKEVHWCLGVINKKDATFQYLDSLGVRDSRIFGVLANYYVDEVKDKCGQDIDVSNWGHEFVDGLPEQQNGFDCGVFMVKYIDFYSRGMGLYFSQEHMPYFRQTVAKEILKLRAE